MKKKATAPIHVRAGRIEFLKVNSAGWEWRDGYHWILSLRWSRFILLVLGLYLTVNILFATAYALGGNCIAEIPAGSFFDDFFFSIETFATVGYGHMYPMSTYGHIVTSIEIVSGMFWMAVMTGVIFVRFSRPTARIIFSKVMVIAPFDGKPTLMMRVANGRHQSMVDAEFRIMMHRDEWIVEGENVRRFYELPLLMHRAIMFPAVLTLRHVIDEKSPLYQATLEDMEASLIRFMVSVNGVDTVIPAPVNSQHDYHWKDIRFGEQFVDVYSESPSGAFYVDYALLDATQPAGAMTSPAPRV